eukprot:scaffold277203_cov37-Tisochrysis_lutea.AAC.2
MTQRGSFCASACSSLDRASCARPSRTSIAAIGSSSTSVASTVGEVQHAPQPGGQPSPGVTAAVCAWNSTCSTRSEALGSRQRGGAAVWGCETGAHDSANPLNFAKSCIVVPVDRWITRKKRRERGGHPQSDSTLLDGAGRQAGRQERPTDCTTPQPPPPLGVPTKSYHKLHYCSLLYSTLSILEL